MEWSNLISNTSIMSFELYLLMQTNNSHFKTQIYIIHVYIYFIVRRENQTNINFNVYCSDYSKF